MALTTMYTFLMVKILDDGYFLSADRAVVSTKTYYTKSGSTYTQVSSPTGDPRANGYYEQQSADGFVKLTDIKEFPNLGGEPEQIDVTTLTNSARVYINGIQNQEALTFTTNYEKVEYAWIESLGGAVKQFSVYFGGTDSNGVVTPTGDKGKFTFSGQISCYVNGKGVNEAQEMTITINPTTEVAFE